MTADKDDIAGLTQVERSLLREYVASRVGKDDLGTFWEVQANQGGIEGLGFHQHPWTASKGRIINGAVNVGRELPRIYRSVGDFLVFNRAPQDAESQGQIHHLREQGHVAKANHVCKFNRFGILNPALSDVDFYPFLRDRLIERQKVAPGSGFNAGAALLNGFFALAFFTGAVAGLMTGRPLLAAIASLGTVGLMALSLRQFVKFGQRPSEDTALRIFEGNLLNWAKRKSRERDPIVMALLESISRNLTESDKMLQQAPQDANWMEWKAKVNEAQGELWEETMTLSKDLLRPGDYENAASPSFSNGLPETLDAKYRDLLKLARMVESLHGQIQSDLAIGTLSQAAASTQKVMDELAALKEAYEELG